MPWAICLACDWKKWAIGNGAKVSTSPCILFKKKKIASRLTAVFTTQTKFLWFIFDCGLSFLPPVQMLKTKCLEALHLQSLCGIPTADFDSTNLFNLYRLIIRSKLHYGNIVCGFARKEYKRYFLQYTLYTTNDESTIYYKCQILIACSVFFLSSYWDSLSWLGNWRCKSQNTF